MISQAPAPLATTSTLPPAVQAVQLAFQVMRRCGATTWAGLDQASIDELCQLTDAQRRALQTAEALGLTKHLSRAPLTSIAYCDSCGEHYWISGKAPGARCLMTFGCPGSVTKAPSTAPRVSAA